MAMDPAPLSLSLPMDPPASAGIDSNPNLIPLLCHICPKKPAFSDVSHLLTHISSKSHLAARFKLQLSDVAVDKQALHRFDEWAEQYGINKLLKNRQDAKELKKQNHLKRQRGGNEVSPCAYPPMSLIDTDNLPRKQKRPRRSNGTRTDVKLEPSNSIHLQVESNPLNQSSWQLHTPHLSFSDPYQTPPIKRSDSVYPLPDSPQDVAFINGALDIRFAPDILDGVDNGSGAAKLKGIVLPGMDLFDAATPDQRRMRNQKKHESVLKNMTKASESIEQTEYVWDDQLLSITRTRNVYDSPSVDGSPVNTSSERYIDPREMHRNNTDSTQESKDEEIPVVKKRRARRTATVGNTSQRQTRASTRGSKASKRGPVGAGKKALKAEEEIDSEEENHGSQSGHALSVYSHNVNDNLMGGDVFADHHLGMPS